MKLMYMPNARRPNATYIPLTGIGGWRLVKRNFKVPRRVKREKFASPNTRDTNLMVFLVLGNAKVPNANDFASQWNIDLNLDLKMTKYQLALPWSLTSTYQGPQEGVDGDPPSVSPRARSETEITSFPPPTAEREKG